jgi:endoglucanase
MSRKRASAAAALGLVAALLGCGPSETASPLAAAETAAPNFPVKRCVQIANALNAPKEGEWGYKIEFRHLDRIAEAGFDTIRLPVNWAANAAESPPYRIDPALIARTDAVFRHALDRGLNVIFTMHNYEAMYQDPRGQRQRLVALWRALATHYRDWPAELIFEPFNEPAENFQGPLWNETAAELVAIIRETNPTRTIILGGDDWNNPAGLSRFRVPDDPFVVTTVHYYAPWEFAIQGAEWLPKAPKPGSVSWGGSAAKAEIAADFDGVARWAKDRGRIMFLGEFGVHVSAPPADRAEWHRAVRQAAEARGMPWCVHDFITNYGIYDRQRESWDAALFVALMDRAPPR